MLVEELRCRLDDLASEIEETQKAVQPLEEKLRRLKEYRQSILKVLEMETGPSSINGRRELLAPRKPGGEVHWSAVAADHGYAVGGDSAHRVVRKINPELHASIAHHCTYDRRTYP